MISLSDVQIEDYRFSLSKLVGSNIKDIEFMISNEFGFPVIQLLSIDFEDGSSFSCEGEHDIAYVTKNCMATPNNTNLRTLARLYAECNEEDYDEDAIDDWDD